MDVMNGSTNGDAIDAFNGHAVLVGNCGLCQERRVLITYGGDCYCTRCISRDEHLSSVIGWSA